MTGVRRQSDLNFGRPNSIIIETTYAPGILDNFPINYSLP